MSEGTRQEDVTLLDVLVDGFEKNETMGGFHWRSLPVPDEASAVRKFALLAAEATAWKGRPLREQEERTRRIGAWADLEIRQAGRAIMVRARAPRFDSWWHDTKTWEGDPMNPIHDWLEEERGPTP